MPIFIFLGVSLVSILCLDIYVYLIGMVKYMFLFFVIQDILKPPGKAVSDIIWNLYVNYPLLIINGIHGWIFLFSALLKLFLFKFRNKNKFIKIMNLINNVYFFFFLAYVAFGLILLCMGLANLLITGRNIYDP